MQSSVFEEMTDSERQVADFLKELGLFWVYESPIFLGITKSVPECGAPTSTCQSKACTLRFADQKTYPTNIEKPMQPPSKSTIQTSTQQQDSAQPQPTSPKNEASTEPVVPRTNVTQPAQKASMPQGSGLEVTGFPPVIEYGIALGASVALVEEAT